MNIKIIYGKLDTRSFRDYTAVFKGEGIIRTLYGDIARLGNFDVRIATFCRARLNRVVCYHGNGRRCVNSNCGDSFFNSTVISTSTRVTDTAYHARHLCGSIACIGSARRKNGKRYGEGCHYHQTRQHQG